MGMLDDDDFTPRYRPKFRWNPGRPQDSFAELQKLGRGDIHAPGAGED